MAKRITKNHYIASLRHNGLPTPVHIARSTAYSDGEDSQHTSSERTTSEYTSVIRNAPPHHSISRHDRTSHNNNNTNYTVLNEYNDRNRVHSALSRGSAYDNGSDIYISSGALRPPSEISSRVRSPSHYSYPAAPSVDSTIKTKTSRKGDLTLDAMAAPNPFCPNIKGVCCLMLLLNLGAILITLGFVIVIQFFEPLYVWILGIIFLIFGFLTLIGSLIYCVVICNDIKPPTEINLEDLYWTHHWQKHIETPEIHYKVEEKAYSDDRYSDRYSISKASENFSERKY